MQIHDFGFNINVKREDEGGVSGVPLVHKAERLRVMRCRIAAIPSINKRHGRNTWVNLYYIFILTIIYHTNMWIDANNICICQSAFQMQEHSIWGADTLPPPPPTFAINWKKKWKKNWRLSLYMNYAILIILHMIKVWEWLLNGEFVRIHMAKLFQPNWKKCYPSLFSCLKITPFLWQNTDFSAQNNPF